jgi:hypothetical protein
MKVLAWISSAVLVTATGVVWLRSLSVPTDLVTDEVAGARDVDRALPGDGSMRRSAVGAPQPGPAVAPHLLLVQELWSVLGRRTDEDARQEQRLLRALVDDGSDEAVAAVVEALEDERCLHRHDGARVQALLMPLTAHVRIYHLARRRVESLTVAGGQGFAVARLTPWFQLAARHGGRNGALYVMSHLRADDPVLLQAAAVAAGRFEDSATRKMLLATLLEDVGLGAEAAKLLAFELTRTEDLALREELFETALHGVGDPLRRALLLEFLGPFLDEERLQDYLTLYRGSDDDALKAAVFRGLRRLTPHEGLADPVLALILGTFALELVADADETRSSQGATLLRDVEALHDVSGAAAALQARLEQGTSATLASVLKTALAALGH